MNELSIYSQQRSYPTTNTNTNMNYVITREAPSNNFKSQSQFEDPGDFLEMNMNALTACLSNSQNREEICKLIGLPSVAGVS